MKKIEINFEKSGIKICRNLGLTIYAIGGFCCFWCIIVGIKQEIILYFLPYAIMALIASLAFGSALIALSFIAKQSIIANIQRSEYLNSKGVELEFYDGNEKIILSEIHREIIRK